MMTKMQAGRERCGAQSWGLRYYSGLPRQPNHAPNDVYAKYLKKCGGTKHR